MKRVIRVALLASLTCCAAQAAEDTTASRLVPGQRPFGEPEVQVRESHPVQFALVLSREMPTPGYRFELDSLDIDEERGRIVAKVTEVRPGGMVAQVMTKTDLRLDLGWLKTGRYLLEIWTRRGREGRHRLTQAMLLVASRPKHKLNGD